MPTCNEIGCANPATTTTERGSLQCNDRKPVCGPCLNRMELGAQARGYASYQQMRDEIRKERGIKCKSLDRLIAEF